MQVPVRELISGMGAPLTGDGRGHEGGKGSGRDFQSWKEFLLIQCFLSGDAGVE